MTSLADAADARVAGARIEDDALIVELMDGRAISAPLAWFPRLLAATDAERANWRIAGGGYGLHWPDIDEDISTEGLLRGAPSPERRLDASNDASRSDQVRRHALDRFVEPARRSGTKDISIPVRDIHDALRLEHRFPLVISALMAKKFWDANGLSKPWTEGPAQSSTTVLHFRDLT